MARKITRGDRVIKFIEKYCKTPEGALVGKPIKLAPFQRKFIKAVYDNKHGTKRAYLSIARKNGKSALIAGIMLAHIIGPEAVQNSQIVSGAMSREQASLVFKLASKMIALNPELEQLARIVPSQRTIIGLRRNVEFKALAADSHTAHGLSPVLAVLDEVGQIRGPSSDFIDAITTSMGAHTAPLLIAISTSAAADADLFSIWLDDAERSKDKHTVSHVYKADENCKLLTKSQWKKANPALGIFRSEEDLRYQLEEADRLPTKESAARNLLLNQRVSAERAWLAAKIWGENGQEVDFDVFKNNPVSIGLDLSARNDLTAAVIAASDDSGVVHIFPFVFCPTNGIEERSRRDRTPYDVWCRGGDMIALGGNTVDYQQICEYLRDTLPLMGIHEIASIEFDRWRIDVFKRAAEDAGWSDALNASWQEVGQGYKDFSPRCEAFETLLLEGRLRHGGHPLLTMAAANAIAVRDPTNAVKLDKSKSTNRIDPIVAAVMAVYPQSDGEIDGFVSDVNHWIA